MGANSIILAVIVAKKVAIKSVACTERVNPFKPEFTIVIFIHCKLQIAAVILDL